VPVSINKVRSGLTILLDTQVYVVLECQHVKPGKGGAFVRTKLRNLKDGKILEKTFKGDQTIEVAFIEAKRLQYLFRSAKIYNFIDQESFDELSISEDILGENAKFLKDNLPITAYFYKEDILNVTLPNFIEVKVVQTEPGLRGNTVGTAMKSATLETGATVQVPSFIKENDLIKVDTRSGEYVERV
jgi:elongation factor P